MNDALDLALSLGNDFAGTVEWDDLVRALNSQRFRILLVERNCFKYRIVLKAKY